MTDRRSSLDFYEPLPAAALPLSKTPAPVAQPSLGDIWRAAVTTSSADLASAEQDRIHDAWAPVIEQLNDGRPWGMRFHNPGSSNTHPDIYLSDENGNLALDRPDTGSLEETAWAAVEAARERDPKAFPELPGTLAAFRFEQYETAKQNIADARGVLARNQSWAGSATSFLGGTINSTRDPLIAASTIYMPFAGAGKTLFARALTTGLMNAGITALEQPEVAQSRRTIGETLTPGEAAENIIGAGVLGFGLHVAGEKVLAPLAKGAIAAGRDLADAARAKIGSDAMTDAERTAADALDRDAEVAATSPFTEGAGTDRHMAKMEQARQALTDPDAARVTADAPVPRETPPAPRFDFSAFAMRVGKVESDGYWQRKADGSSAYGMWQLTHDTFVRFSGGGVEGERAWANRTNPAVQQRAFQNLTQHNRKVLASIGAPETNGNLYLLHFAGEVAGADVLRAAPDTPVAEIMSAEAIKANPFLKDMTAEDLIGWAANKMGEAPHTGPVVRRDQFADDELGNAEWRQAQAAVDAETAAEGAAAGNERAQAARDLTDPGDPRTWDMSDEQALAVAEPDRAAAQAAPFDNGASNLRAEQTSIDEAPAASNMAAEFTTEKGSTYRIEQDGTTTRNKAARPEHPGEQGTQPTSERTVYADPAEIEPLGLIQTRGGHPVRLIERANHVALEYAAGPEQGKIIPGTVIPVRSTPEIGLVPIERWNGGEKVHFGNKIVAIDRQPRRDLALSKSRDDLAPTDHSAAPVSKDITGFDNPDDAAALRQTESLEHDVRMLLAGPEGKDLTVQLTEDSKPVSAAAAIEDADQDLAAIARAQACLKPPAAGGEA